MKTEPTSSVFRLEPLETSQGTEQILRGGRNLFSLLPQAFDGIKQIGVIGLGPQGLAQSQCTRDSLAFIGSDIVVKVGLQFNSKSLGAARQAGFKDEGDEPTLGTIEEIVPNSDLVVLLIPDADQTKLWQHITGLMKPGATLGLSHGFLYGHLKSTGQKLRDDINVILMAPKGMGKSVRKLYLQGEIVNGAGINSSVAVEQDVNGHALDYALGWAVAVGSPVVFFTTMENELNSDLTGERGPLLGYMWGAVEALYKKFCGPMGGEAAFLATAKGLTSTVSDLISKHGLLGFYRQLGPNYQNAFRRGYVAAYAPVKQTIENIYAIVSSGAEIAEVVKATAALEHTPMSDIETSEMWEIGKSLYAYQPLMNPELAYSAGVYIAGIMALMQVLLEHGHCISEMVNESLIEAIDSLNPFMDKRGVSHMVDNCSRTARLGARKWGPRFKQALAVAMVSGVDPTEENAEFASFLANPLHEDIAKCFALRPTVKLIVD